MCETFISEQNKHLFELQGYQMFSQNRSAMLKGGVAPYVNKKYASVEISDLRFSLQGTWSHNMVVICKYYKV